MNLLKIINNNAPEFKYHSKSCITTDHKMLCLSYRDCGYYETEYDEYFDKLNSEIQLYDKLETLILDSDSKKLL